MKTQDNQHIIIQADETKPGERNQLKSCLGSLIHQDSTNDQTLAPLYV
jgi:hypothetical protein